MVRRFHYRWMIVNDFLPRMCGADVIDSLLPGRETGAMKVTTRFYKPGNRLRPMMPTSTRAPPTASARA